MFKIIYITLISLFLISWYQTGNLPGLQEIDERLLQEPVQQIYTNKENFSFSYRQKSYNVKPIADYELWGLVVSQNNIAAWFNYYHDKGSVNLKDICVVWDIKYDIDRPNFIAKVGDFKSHVANTISLLTVLQLIAEKEREVLMFYDK